MEISLPSGKSPGMRISVACDVFKRGTPTSAPIASVVSQSQSWRRAEWWSVFTVAAVDVPDNAGIVDVKG